MELENEPIENSKEVVKRIFQKLLERVELIPENWNQSYTYLIGLAVWDIFSNNHEVISPNGKIYDIGSWRGSGSTISEVIHSHFKGKECYDYIDFYMGSVYQAEEVNLIKIYEEIFSLLKILGCDWHYTYPRIYLIDFKNKNAQEQDNLSYNPNNALADEMSNRKRESELKNLQDKLDEDYIDDLEKSKKKPLPNILIAFKNIYGYLPKGCPF